ncbi:MAG: hypothetical protein PVH29_10620 [Candidatus Zixiibacteriota bacterium]|jgi:hypothetical protein
MDGGELSEIPAEKLPYEDNIHEVLEKDLSLVSDEVLIVGSHVSTEFGTEADIIGIESNGDLVIIELKRDKTPAEVMAQALGYAAWVSRVDYETITDIAIKHYGDEANFLSAFNKKFGLDGFPDTINSAQRIIIVAGALDPNTENIIRYLSEQYGLPVNAVLFEYFKDGKGEFLSKTTVIEEETARIQAVSKKRAKYVPLTKEQLEEWADNLGIRGVYDKALSLAEAVFTWSRPIKYGISFDLQVQEDGGHYRRSILGFYLNESSAEKGLYVLAYHNRVKEYFDFDVNQWILDFNGEVVSSYGPDCPPDMITGYGFFLREDEDIRNFFLPLAKEN